METETSEAPRPEGATEDNIIIDSTPGAISQPSPAVESELTSMNKNNVELNNTISDQPGNSSSSLSSSSSTVPQITQGATPVPASASATPTPSNSKKKIKNYDQIKSLPTKAYLEQTVAPIVMKAMTKLAYERPDTDPVEWVAKWIMDNNPNKTNDQNEESNNNPSESSKKKRPRAGEEEESIANSTATAVPSKELKAPSPALNESLTPE